MEKVPFTPTGIAMKQHELYGLDDNLLYEQAMNLRADIVKWALNNFILDDQQVSWLYGQGGDFREDFAQEISTGLTGRGDFNIEVKGPIIWKSKRIHAKTDTGTGFNTVTIFVERFSYV